MLALRKVVNALFIIGETHHYFVEVTSDADHGARHSAWVHKTFSSRTPCGSQPHALAPL